MKKKIKGNSMSKLKQNFFGYTKQSVNAAIEALEMEARQLKAEVKEQDEQILQLTEAINNTKAEEELIREAIIDAKQLSHRSVNEAKLKCKELVTDAEKSMQTQFEEFKGSLIELEASRQDLALKKETLYQELEATLHRYQLQLTEAENDLEKNLSRLDSTSSLSAEDDLALFEKRIQNFGFDVDFSEKPKKNKQLIVFPSPFAKEDSRPEEYSYKENSAFLYGQKNNG